MSEQKTVEPELPAIVKKAPELMPVYDWWVKEGRSTLLMLAIGAACVGGFYAARNWLDARTAAANAALVNAFATDELETAVADYGSTKAGPALKLRLAKSYYDAERYQDALDTYTGLLGKMEKNGPFTDIVEMGRAAALEGLTQYKEAKAAYAGYAADTSKSNSWLLLTAQLGAARCTALLGDKDAAVKELDALNAKSEDRSYAKVRIERLTDAVKRYDPARTAPSLFDAANAAAKSLENEKKAEKPAAVKPAEKKAAAPVEKSAQQKPVSEKK